MLQPARLVKVFHRESSTLPDCASAATPNSAQLMIATDRLFKTVDPR